MERPDRGRSWPSVAFATHQHPVGDPSLRAWVQLSQPLKRKRAAQRRPSPVFGGGGGSLSLRYRSTDLRFAPATRALQAQVQLSRRTNKKTTRWVAFPFVGGGGGS
jgi:hypothetical protein